MTQAHAYQNWRHVSIISSVTLVDKDGNPLDVNDERYSAFGGYVSSRPTRLIASTVPAEDNEGKDCVIVGINSRWNEKVVNLYENIYFDGVEPNTGTSLKSYGAGIFPVEGWAFNEITVQKDSELHPRDFTSSIHFQHEISGEAVSVDWEWLPQDF
jgi:hypothetical protein